VSFLSDYRIIADETEAHPTYHLFTALVTLSSIISRRVWLKMGQFDVFPNLYVVLVGPPGNRKTAAMRIGKKVLRALEDIPFSAEATTKEKLVLDMADNQRVIDGLPEEYSDYRLYAPLTVMVTELSQFIGAGAQHMIDFLVTVYDQDFYDYKTKNRGESKIDGPYLNVLACTTPDWITFYLKTDVISGGFSRRAIFVFETEKGRRVAIPSVSEEAKLATDRVVEYGRRLKAVSGPFRWDADAVDFYTNWYDNLKIPTEETIAGYYDSKHIQLLKIAMLLAISESTELVLLREHIENALGMLGLVEANLTRVFEGIGRNELNAVSGKVLDILRRSPSHMFTDKDGAREIQNCLLEKQIRGSLWRHISDPREAERIFQHLIDSDKIIRFSTTSPTTGLQRTFIALKSGVK
jgi:hypothetical protein